MPQIDPMTTLAFSVAYNKGVYALLLGSGVSRAAAIMTGWEIVLDLIKKVAAAENQDCGPEPADWFKQRYGKDPDYSNLLEKLANTPADRRQLLQSYFEPSEQEREEGKKTPTAAHKAIAKLVADGHIRVIVTTNFDRLLEQALEASGVVPNVIASPAAARGATPLVHLPCTVVKVHGDYLDTDFKNTKVELESFDPEMNRLLDQIFDEYGLIVCGWSAQWDEALRDAVDRCKTRRFSTFWSALHEPTGLARDLCNRRNAVVIPEKNADEFFEKLGEMVTSLVEIGARHPLETSAAVATLKRFMAEDRHRIRLHDLVMDEVKSAVSAGSTVSTVSTLPAHRGDLIASFAKESKQIVSLYDSQFDCLLRLLINGGYWGRRSQKKLWFRAIETVARDLAPDPGKPNDKSCVIGGYPAMLLFYGCGIASLAGERYATLALLLSGGHFKENKLDKLDKLDKSLLVHLFCLDFYSNTLKILDYYNTDDNPFSIWGARHHLNLILKDPLKHFISDEAEFTRHFKKLEYFIALAFADWELQQADPKKRGVISWVPPGSYLDSGNNVNIVSATKEEIERLGARWPLLRAGLFGGSVDRLQAAVSLVDTLMRVKGPFLSR